MNTILKYLAPLAVGALMLSGCGGQNASTEGGTTTAEAPAAPASNAAPSSAEGAPAGGAKLASVSTGKPVGSVKVGGKALCSVCAVKEGKRYDEAVAATIDYKGKTYPFCNASEKAEFISAPAKYAK